MGEGPSSERPSDEPRTPLQALAVLAAQEVAVTPALRHLELFTMGGLLTLLWHHPPDADEDPTAAVVACGGAMGGLLGPAEGLYQRLGDHLAEQGVPLLRVSYRRPNDLDACCLDVAAAVQLLTDRGAERVVVMGHSFGGAVAIRVAVAMPSAVARCGHLRDAVGRLRVGGGPRGPTAAAVPRRARRAAPRPGQ